jgi:hypothetical protein
MKDRLLQFFEYEHLPGSLQVASKPFCDLAHSLVDGLPAGPERTTALRKLLEAKDCAVRALIYRKAAVKPRTLRSGISGEQVDDGSRATQYRVFGV